MVEPRARSLRSTSSRAAWQAQVQDQQVELVRGQRGVGLGAAGHAVHRVADARSARSRPSAST
jgi:hypothetical protein